MWASPTLSISHFSAWQVEWDLEKWLFCCPQFSKGLFNMKVIISYFFKLGLEVNFWTNFVFDSDKCDMRSSEFIENIMCFRVTVLKIKITWRFKHLSTISLIFFKTLNSKSHSTVNSLTFQAKSFSELYHWYIQYGYISLVFVRARSK